MASIIEELVDVLNKENEIYLELIPVAETKAQIIIKNDLIELQKVNDTEQEIIESILLLEKRREDVVNNIALVLNKNTKDLNLKKIIELLGNQPKEQLILSQLYDKLTNSVQRLVEINSRNKMLIEESLDMIQFNMNLLNSTRVSPGSNTYNKSAFENKNQSYDSGIFDTKQ